MGQIAGDALGSQVEGYAPETIRRLHPTGLRDLMENGRWNTLAGQPTDDTEMAFALARRLVNANTYDPVHAREAYQEWLASIPFDCGSTVRAGLAHAPLMESQANGAMMRISPLGIFGARFSPEAVAEWAALDARITHPHRVCVEVNQLFVRAIAQAVREPIHSRMLHELIGEWADQEKLAPEIRKTIRNSRSHTPDDFITFQGWVLIAFQNALCLLHHEVPLEEALVETVMSGGDTDTNAAICGALLGAVQGLPSFPQRWREVILDCRPEQGAPGVLNPRPKEYWPVDALELAAALLGNTIQGEGHE